MTTDTTDLLPRKAHRVRAAHRVFVTKYRRPMFTGELVSSCEHITRTVGADIEAKLVECNGESDHAQPLVTYPPTFAISELLQWLKGSTA